VSLSTLLLCLLGLAVVAFFVGFARARMLAHGEERSLHSRPGYHGGYLALWTSLPAVLVLLAWAAVGPRVIDGQVQTTLPAQVLQGSEAQIGLTMSVVRSVASGLKTFSREELQAAKANPQEAQRLLSEKGIVVASAPDAAIIQSAQLLDNLKRKSRLAQTFVAALLAIAGFAFAFTGFTFSKAFTLAFVAAGFTGAAFFVVVFFAMSNLLHCECCCVARPSGGRRQQGASVRRANLWS